MNPSPCVPCCSSPQLVNVPGIDGADGADGATGAAGPSIITCGQTVTSGCAGILSSSGNVVTSLGDPLPIANGGTGATSATIATQQLGTTYRLLGVLKAADFNVTTDQPIAGFPAKWIPRRITAQNASVDMTTAAGGIYTAAGKTGTVIVAAAQVYTALSTAAKWKDLTIDNTGGGPTTDVQTATSVFFALTTGQGAPATGDIYIWGEDLS